MEVLNCMVLYVPEQPKGIESFRKHVSGAQHSGRHRHHHAAPALLLAAMHAAMRMAPP